MAWIERQKNILDFALSGLLRRKGKNLALITAYTLVIFSLASVMFFTLAIQQEAAQVLRGAPEIVVQRLMMGRHELIPESFADQIAQITGVASVRPRLWGYYYDPTTGANYTLMAQDDHPEGAGSIVVGRGVARNLGVAVEGLIPLKTYGGSYEFFRVARILPAASELVSTDLILLGREDFRTVFALPEGVATDLALTARNQKELPTIADKITRIFPDTRPILRDEILSTYDAVFSWRGGMIIVVLATAVFAFVILAWDKATGLSAEERREIGILKALGWETADVLLMKYWEGAVISVSAFLAGILLAYGHIFLTSSAVFTPALKGWSVLYPDFKLTPRLDAYQITALFFLTVLPYTVATIVPSWRAATVDPDTVMRG